jgi:hypothetical protein
MATLERDLGTKVGSGRALTASPASVVNGVRIPSPEEWQERADRAIRKMECWEKEPLSDDLATFEEIRAAVERDPVRLKESV